MFQLVGFLKIEAHIIGGLCGIIEDFVRRISAFLGQGREQNLRARPRPTELFTPPMINLAFVDISKKRKRFSESSRLPVAHHGLRPMI